MFKKLDKMLERYEKLNELVSDSEVLSRMDEWRAYTKELADMQETVDKYLEYKKVLKEQTDAKELYEVETDKEIPCSLNPHNLLFLYSIYSNLFYIFYTFE